MSEKKAWMDKEILLDKINSIETLLNELEEHLLGTIQKEKTHKLEELNEEIKFTEMQLEKVKEEFSEKNKSAPIPRIYQILEAI